MADHAPGPLGTVTLVTGPEEFLNERVVHAARAAVRGADPQAEVSEAVGDELTAASLGELSAPSLFTSTRCVVLRRFEEAPNEVHDDLLTYAATPDPDIALVLVHSGGQKGTGLLAKLRKLQAVHEHRSEQVKGNGLHRFVRDEVRANDGRMEPDAAVALVEAVGGNLRALAAAADQLTHDFPSTVLSVDVVRQYFAGRADVKGFEVADLALSGRTAAALEQLRWALATGATGPAITGSFASAVRGLARLHGAPRGMRDADLAREVGAPPWKLRVMREQLRSWDEPGLATAVRAVATADAEVKGAGADGSYALERMVLTISRARQTR